MDTESRKPMGWIYVAHKKGKDLVSIPEITVSLASYQIIREDDVGREYRRNTLSEAIADPKNSSKIQEWYNVVIIESPLFLQL